MTSVKLTQSMRDTVENALMEKSIHQGALDEFFVRYHAFAVRVYEDVFSKKQREKMEELPEGWLPTLHCITAQFGSGQYCYASLNFYDLRYASREKVKEVTKRFPSNMLRNACKVYDDKDKLAIEFHAFKKEKEAIRKAMQDLRMDIRSILNSCTTTKKLYETWPEMEPILAKYVPKEQGQRAALPAKIIRDVTKQINLEAKKAD